MKEINELNQHEDILTKKGKNIAKEVLSQTMNRSRSEEPKVSRHEEHEETTNRQTEDQSSPHVSPSTYLQTPPNSPLHSLEKVQEQVVQEKVREQESQGQENFVTSPDVIEIQLRDQQEEPEKEATEVVPSGKKVLIIPSGEEEERP